VQLTLDTYSHLIPDLRLKEKAVERFDAILGRADEVQRPQDYGQNTDKDNENLVSRDGIEPSTRRLRVCCSAN
jgi:hypothetical protein